MYIKTVHNPVLNIFFSFLLLIKRHSIKKKKKGVCVDFFNREEGN